MSNLLEAFEGPWGLTGLVSPQNPLDRARSWSTLRSAMVRNKPDEFTRDEWAYLIQFLSEETLRRFFESAFGGSVGTRDAGFVRLARGRDGVVIVLPNNVSLLGPLMLVVASLSAQTIFVKVGTRGDNLVAPFVAFAEAQGSSELRKIVASVEVARLDRTSEILRDRLARASVRIAFGSDAAISAVDQVPHAPGSRFLGFGNMYSEAWIDRQHLNDATAEQLIRVFAIYGQAGCTSPRRVVILNASHENAMRWSDRLVELWPQIAPAVAAPHTASQNLLFHQLATHAGAHARLTPGNRSVVGVADRSAEIPEGPQTLILSGATLDEAVRSTPSNLQTLGLAVSASTHREIVQRAAGMHVRRMVPLAQMHHFGSLWDGYLLAATFYDFIETTP